MRVIPENARAPRTKPPRGSYLSVLLRPKAYAVEDDLRNYTMEYRRFPLRTRHAELPCCPSEAFEVPSRRSGLVPTPELALHHPAD